MNRRGDVGGDAGFTLVEFLLAAAILVFVLASVSGVVWAAQMTTKQVSRWSDRTQQLRVALNQIGEDLSYAQWNSGAPGGGDVFSVEGWQMLALDRPMAPEWETAGLAQYWEGWPGYFGAARSAVVQYRLETVSGQTVGKLTRTVYDGPHALQNGVQINPTSKTYVQQSLAFDLNPYDSNPTTGRSYFDVDSSNQVVQVVLRATRSEAGGNTVAEVSGQWYVP